MQRLGRKVAVLSHVLHPSPSGQSVMLFRVLQNVDPTDYVLINSGGVAPAQKGTSPTSRVRSYGVSGAISLPFRGRRFLGRLPMVLDLAVNVGRRAVQVARVARREKCAAIVACTGDVHDLPAAYLASRLLGISFHPYLFDDYVFQWPPSGYRRFAQWISPRLMRHAQSIIVPNEFLSEEYLRRYGVTSEIVRNPTANAVDSTVPERESPSKFSAAVRVVYTGSVYHAHYDAFLNLIAALARIPGRGVELHVYTANDPEALRGQGINGQVVFHSHQPADAMAGVLSSADILFLPLAFRTTIPEVIRTSAPGKMGEYLASGRPILVHAPADSFVAWYFRTYNCGLVVDELSPDRMEGAILQLTGDVAARAKLVANARERARVDFDLQTSQEAFVRALDTSVNSALDRQHVR